MKTVFLIIIFCLFNSFAQDSWTKLNGPEGGKTGGLFAKGDTILVGTIGSGGLIFFSTDRGMNFHQANIKVYERFSGFTYTNDNAFIAAGFDNGLFKSFNLSEWICILPLQGERIWSVGRDLSGNLYAGTESGRIYASTDNGLTWNITVFTHYRIENFLSTNNYIFAGSNNNVLRKVHADTIWKIITVTQLGSLRIFNDNLNNLYAIKTAEIFKSTDEGDNWIQLNTGTFFYGEFMNECIFNNRIIGAFNDETDWFGIGWGAAVSDDYGITWHWSQTGLPPKISAFRITKSGDDTYIGTIAAGVYKSTNFGDSWFSANKGITAAVVPKFIIAKDGSYYATAWSSGISKSTDNGETWFTVNNGVTNYRTYSIVECGNGDLIAGTAKGMFKSTNKGDLWTQIPGPGNNIDYQLFRDKYDRIYSLNYGGGIHRSSDNGNSWTRLGYGVMSPYVFGFSIDSTNNIYVGTKGGRIYKSGDDGTTWSQIYQSSNTSSIIFSISISPNGYIFASNIYEGILRSKDSGTTWQLVRRDLNFLPMFPIAVNQKGEIYTTGSDKKIYFSNDDGDTWEDITSNAEMVEIWDITFHDKEVYLATDESVWRSNFGYIPVELSSFTAEQKTGTIELKWTTSTETNNRGYEIQRNSSNGEWEKRGFVEGNGTTTEPKKYSFTEELSQPEKYSYRLKQIDYDGKYKYSEILKVDFIPVPKEFSLKQNYPNPFNPTTTIKYSLPEKSNITIIIYDALGREITKLLDDDKPAGEYEVNWNAENNPTGVYFCRMKAENYTETRKLILVK